MHTFSPTPLAVVAFSLQALGMLLLVPHARSLGHVIDLVVMATLLAVSGVYWFKFAGYDRAMTLMKLQFVVGLYFLF